MVGIPVRDVFTEYDKEYILHIEGFVDTYGIEMEPQDIIIRTLLNLSQIQHTKSMMRWH